MAARRNKSQATRNNSGGGGGVPAWGWLVLGLALGIGVFLIAPKFLGGDDSFFRPQSDDGTQPTAIDNTDPDRTPIAENNDNAPTDKNGAESDTSNDPDYDFYTLLPGEETAMSDAELADRTQAEEAEQTRSPTETTTPGDSNATRPEAIDAAPPAAIDTPSPPKPSPKPSSATASAGTASSDNDTTRYLLQAGAFAASGDAEALKAKIAFLGLSARVESAQIDSKTVFRVRMGPYGTATELAEAKKTLAGGGLPAMAIKVK